jgi:hypothetical protein
MRVDTIALAGLVKSSATPSDTAEPRLLTVVLIAPLTGERFCSSGTTTSG